MRSLVFIMALMMISVNSYSSENPQRRTCRIHNSLFWTYDISTPKEDIVGFCRFGEASVGTITLMKYFNEGLFTKALNAFYITKGRKFTSCFSAKAISIKGFDFGGSEESFCVFSDYSFIKESTLVDGWNGKSNRLLKAAL